MIRAKNNLASENLAKVRAGCKMFHVEQCICGGILEAMFHVEQTRALAPLP